MGDVAAEVRQGENGLLDEGVGVRAGRKRYGPGRNGSTISPDSG